MFEKILASIQRVGRFSEKEQTLFVDKLKNLTIQKNDCLLKEGQVCSAVYFINTGAIRQSHITENGDELTLNLLTAEDWVLDFDSFMQQKQAKNTLTALEKTDVFELTVHGIHALIAESQAFLLLGKFFQHGLRDSIYDTLPLPEDKYKHLLQHKPQLLQAFPLKYIASYLKMTPETLSRVRRKINE
jgi:CRP-like cAMP-binding protein